MRTKLNFLNIVTHKILHTYLSEFLRASNLPPNCARMRSDTLLTVFVLAFSITCFGFTCVPFPVVKPTETKVPYQLGSLEVNITTYTQPNANGESGLYSFINLHENENTSVVAAKTLIYQKGGGSIVFLQHGGTRNLYFTYKGVNYSIDPNRMFTYPGTN